MVQRVIAASWPGQGVAVVRLAASGPVKLLIDRLWAALSLLLVVKLIARLLVQVDAHGGRHDGSRRVLRTIELSRGIVVLIAVLLQVVLLVVMELLTVVLRLQVGRVGRAAGAQLDCQIALGPTRLAVELVVRRLHGRRSHIRAV